MDRSKVLYLLETLPPEDVGFVYLAGPYMGSSPTHDHSAACDIDVNINEARRWAIRMAEDGIPFVCPHLNSAHFEMWAPGAEPSYWYPADLTILAQAKAVFMLHGWRDSKGAKLEFHFARDREMPIYFSSGYVSFQDAWQQRLEELQAARKFLPSFYPHAIPTGAL